MIKEECLMLKFLVIFEESVCFFYICWMVLLFICFSKYGKFFYVSNKNNLLNCEGSLEKFWIS